MNVSTPDGAVIAIPDGASQKDINDILNAHVNSLLIPSHGETPPASTVPYDEGLPKRMVRGALKAGGGAVAGLLATPETFGAATIPAAMVGYSAGGLAGEAILGPEPPTAPPAPRETVSDPNAPFMSTVKSIGEGVTRLPESLPRTAEGLMMFPAQAVKSLAAPLAEGDVEGLGKAGWENVKGIAEFMAAPTGLMGVEKARDVWAQDVAGSALGFTGAAKTGAAIGRGGVRAAGRAYEAVEHRVPYTQRNIEVAAGNAFMGGDIRGGGYVGAPLDTLKGPEAALVKISDQASTIPEAQNLAQTTALKGRIGIPDWQETHAQGTGNLKSAFFEQSIAAKTPGVGARLIENDSIANRAALQHMVEAVGSGGAPLKTPDAAVTGATIIDTINRAKEPVKKTMAYLEEQIPDYGMRANNLVEKIGELGKDRGMSDQGFGALGKIAQIMETRAPKGNTTTHELRGIKRTIGQMWKEAKAAGNGEEAFIYNEALKAIEADYDAFSSKVSAEGTAYYRGQEVSVSALVKEKEQNLLRMAELERNLEPDYSAMRHELKAAGVAPREWMSDEPGQQGVLKGQQKALDAYKRFIQKDPPKAAASDGVRGMESYAARNRTITEILDSAAPGADAGAAMRAFNQYAKKEWFGRFDKGAVKDVTAFGGEATGLRTEHEGIGRKLWGQTNASDLIRAVGEQNASAVMLPHMLSELAGKADAHGIMNIPTAVAWINQNKAVLRAYNLEQAAKGVVRTQMRGYIESEIARMTVDKMGAPQMGPLAARKFVEKMTPILRQLGYDAKTTQAFADYHATIQMLARNKNVTFGGNSTTIEKLMGDDSLSGPGGKLVKSLTNIVLPASAVTGAAGAGIFGAGAGAYAGKIAERFLMDKNETARATFRNILVDAMFDPQVASDLMSLARHVKDSAVRTRMTAYAKQVVSDIRSGAQKLKDDQRGMVGKDINVVPDKPAILKSEILKPGDMPGDLRKGNVKGSELAIERAGDGKYYVYADDSEIAGPFFKKETADAYKIGVMTGRSGNTVDIVGQRRGLSSPEKGIGIQTLADQLKLNSEPARKALWDEYLAKYGPVNYSPEARAAKTELLKKLREMDGQ